MNGPIPQSDVVGPASYGVDSTSPPYVGMRQQPTVNTVDSESVPGDQSSTCLSSPILHMPDVRSSGLSIVTSSSPSNISPSASTSLPRDDEPLSTPPALDVPEEASQSFFPPPQMPILDSSTQPSANGGFAAPSLALDSCSNDIPFANQLAAVDIGEQVQKKKKRKRKSDNAEGEDGGSSVAKRNRKKKPKATDADTSVQVLPADSSEVMESVPPAVDDSGVSIPVTQPPARMKKSNNCLLYTSPSPRDS